MAPGHFSPDTEDRDRKAKSQWQFWTCNSFLPWWDQSQVFTAARICYLKRWEQDWYFHTIFGIIISSFPSSCNSRCQKCGYSLSLYRSSNLFFLKMNLKLRTGLRSKLGLLTLLNDIFLHCLNSHLLEGACYISSLTTICFLIY